MMKTIPFEYSYAQLPERFYQRVGPTTFPDLQLLKWNDSYGEELGLSRSLLSDNEIATIFSGMKLNPDAKPLAQAYSGHQFGHFSPRLGDGRALLLAELRHRDGSLKDIHLKGSGRTAFSRSGDGRANLAAIIREYIVSEAMAALGVPTSRSLAIITTGEMIQRETIQPGAILVRVASSHVRIGTFEYFASQSDTDGVRALADYVIARHHPDLAKNQSGYLELFQRIASAQAKLVSLWMQLGFIHGVMNTDNTFISGETLDFGPCAFMEEFNPQMVFSSIDRNGRYAFGRQPTILQWNLGSLAQCFQLLTPLPVEELLKKFMLEFNQSYLEGMLHKLGLGDLAKTNPELGASLIERFLTCLQSNKADYTLSLRQLSSLFVEGSSIGESELWRSEDMSRWLQNWRALARPQGMNDLNPIYIPRNHRVEEAIAHGVAGDFTKFERLLGAISDPYNDRAEFAEYALPAAPHERVIATFCNT